MIIQVRHQERYFICDLSKPLDISIPLGQVKCFYAPDVTAEPFQSGDFIGSVSAGAPVNFYNVSFNPHGNGTHTETLGHITAKQESINQCLRQYHFIAQLISVQLSSTENKDQIISVEELQANCSIELPDALIIRTLPNTDSKLKKDYSGTNPPYLSKEAMEFIVSKKVKHLLLDLPSVDREEDDGALENHRAFWNVKNQKASTDSRAEHTITELIYVPEEILDGLYLLNIQVPSIELDAVPSKPVLYELTESN